MNRSVTVQIPAEMPAPDPGLVLFFQLLPLALLLLCGIALPFVLAFQFRRRLAWSRPKALMIAPLPFSLLLAGLFGALMLIQLSGPEAGTMGPGFVFIGQLVVVSLIYGVGVAAAAIGFRVGRPREVRPDLRDVFK